MSKRYTWEDRADLFKEMAQQAEGWPFAALVACSVRPDAGHGVSEVSGSKRSARTVSSDDLKCSAREFAKRAGASHQTIMRMFRAWENAALEGIVKSAADLSPGELPQTPDDPSLSWRKPNGAYRFGGGPVGTAEPEPKPVKTKAEQAEQDAEEKERFIQMGIEASGNPNFSLDKVWDDATYTQEMMKIEGKLFSLAMDISKLRDRLNDDEKWNKLVPLLSEGRIGLEASIVGVPNDLSELEA